MNRRQAIVALLLLLLGFFAPRLLRGEVIFPHDNAVELGVADAVPSGRIENRWLSDVSSVYVPEVHHHLHGDSSAWISTWNPHVELGRPTMQISGLSPAYPLTRILMWLTADAARLTTWLAVLTLLGCALFGYLFLDALGLHPAACLAAAIGLALGVHSLFWSGFLMYLSGPCWTLCILWLTTRFVRQPSLGRATGIAFAVYALVLTAYPQLVVWEAYLTAGFVVLLLAREPAARGRRAKILGMLAMAALVGALCAAPVFADVAVQASRSSRSGVDADYFLKVVPPIASLRDLLLFLAQTFDVFWIGNPNGPGLPYEFRWISLTPVVAGLLLLAGFDGGWRRCGYWLAFAFACLLLAISPQAYLFGVAHLGLGFSRLSPLVAATIPIAVCTAYAIDRLMRNGVRSRVAAIAIVCVAPAVAAVGLFATGVAFEPFFTTVGIALCLLLGACLLTGRTAWIPALVIVSVFHYGWRVLLTRPESAIHVTSPLVERIREETRGGLRYAVVGFENERLLPPNQEVRLGLSSVHSYDPLSARAYSQWVERISETGTRMYGRQFRRIYSDSRLDSDEIGYSGIRLFVSPRELRSPRIEAAGAVDGIRIYRTRERPALEAQIASFEKDGAGTARLDGPLARQTRLPVERIAAQDDRLEFRLTSAPSTTLLFVSQQYHPQWRAIGNEDGAGEQQLETVEIDGFWQGVLVPPGIRTVELVFRPWVRWSWIPQVLFAVAAAIGGLSSYRTRTIATSPTRSAIP